jgi:hypothetical protein
VGDAAVRIDRRERIVADVDVGHRRRAIKSRLARVGLPGECEREHTGERGDGRK